MATTRTIHQQPGTAIWRAARLLVLAPGIWLAPCGVADEWVQSASVHFTEMPWGRYTEITIEQLPSLESAMEAAADPAKMAQLVAEAQARAQQMQDAPGEQAVVLLIPGLEYGMTGTFTEVRIESGNGISVTKDGKIGARMAPTRTQYTGRVVIEEFTEARLRGSYAADLYNQDMSDREVRARERDFVGRVEASFDIDLSPPDPSALSAQTAAQLGYPQVPEGLSATGSAEVPADLDAQDADLLRQIRDAGVPPEEEGLYLNMLRNLSPDRVRMVLDSYGDSY